MDVIRGNQDPVSGARADEGVERRLGPGTNPIPHPRAGKPRHRWVFGAPKTLRQAGSDLAPTGMPDELDAGRDPSGNGGSILQ